MALTDFPKIESYITNFFYKGLGFQNAPLEVTDTIEHQLYFRKFVLPLTYLASTIPMPYKHVCSRVLPMLQLHPDQWETCITQFKQDTVISINDLITLFDALNIGCAWMYVLDDFAMDFRKNPKQAFKDNFTQEWERFMSKHQLHIAWFGFDTQNRPGCDVYYITPNTLSGEPTCIYNDTPTVPGGNTISNLFKLSFTRFDEHLLVLARLLVAQSPYMQHLFPHMEVECIVDNKTQMQDVYVTDAGNYNIPPIEVIKLGANLPKAEHSEFGSLAGAINYHVSLGSQVDPTVTEWLHSDVVQKFLRTSIGITDTHIETVPTQEKINIPTSHIETERITEESVQPVNNAPNEWKEKYYELLSQYESLQARQRDLQTEIAQQSMDIEALEDKVAKLQKALNRELSTHIPEEETLLEEDKFYPILKWFNIKVRHLIYKDDSAHIREELKHATYLANALMFLKSTDGLNELLFNIHMYDHYSGVSRELMDDMLELAPEVVKDDKD